MASANVRLIQGSSFNGRGYSFRTKGEVKIITNLSDIAYFDGNVRFQVNEMKAAPPPQSGGKKTPPSKPAASADGGDGGPLPWKGNQKKVDLIAAAESRDIVVTEDDKVAEIVQLLREWDEENNAG